MSLSAADQALVSKIFADADIGIQALEVIAELLGVSSAVALSTIAAKLPALTPGGPDEAAEYDAAKTKAEAK
jgi:hypothetical protein